MSLILCPNCQSENQQGQKYCTKCGHELPRVEAPKTDTLRMDYDQKVLKNKRKNKIGIIVGVIGLLVLVSAGWFIYKRAPVFDTVLTMAATEINKSCPVMIDEYTRLDKVEAIPGKIFQYNYTLVGIAKADMDMNAFRESVDPGILETVKTNDELKLYRENKVTMVYVYRDEGGEMLHKYTVTPDMYQ